MRSTTQAQHHDLDLFTGLVGLLRTAGATLRTAPIPDAATWDATTKTLTLRDDADPDDHAWALSEFCRHITLGPDYSRFINTGRHLHTVTG